MSTTRKRMSMAEADAALMNLMDELVVAGTFDDPEAYTAALAAVYADEERIWGQSSSVELDGPISAVFNRARAAALQRAHEYARDYVRMATSYGYLRYLDDARAAGVAHGERV